MNNTTIWLTLLLALAAVLTAGCAATERATRSATLPGDARWVVLPMPNHSETPMAGRRAEAIVAGVLRSRGLTIDAYPGGEQNDADALPTFDGGDERRRARQWANEAGYDYAVTGAVAEWRYKSGLDGAPAVGLTLRVVRLSDGATVWSATGARTGWGRASLSGTGQRVTADLLASLTLER